MRVLWAGLAGAVATAAVEVRASRGGDPYDRNQGFLALLAGLPALTALVGLRQFRPGRFQPGRSGSGRSGPGVVRWLADTGSALAAAAATRALAGRGALPDPAQVPYNYPRFDLRLYSAPAPTIAGCELVAGTVTDLDSGHGVQLRAVVGERPLVLEFGSVTCPVYLSKIDRMRLLTARCTEVANFAVLYTREAHPGPRYPPHATLADKRRHAADLRTLDHEQRRILIDDVDGTVHRRYGTSPDSVLIVGTDGIISFWSEWNEPDRTERELQRLLAAGGRGAHVTPRQIERNFQPPEDSATALRLCLRPGLPAFADFIVQLPGMAADRARAALWR